MDNNFDKLFKTKVEQQQFDYNQSEWESFLKKQASNSVKNSKGFSSQFFIASLIVGVAVISVIAYYLLTNSENNSKNNTVQNISPTQSQVSNNTLIENKRSENKISEPKVDEVKSDVKNTNSKPSQNLDVKSKIDSKNNSENSVANTKNSTAKNNVETAEIINVNETAKVDTKPEQSQNNTTIVTIVQEPKVISESTSNKSNIEINSTSKQIESSAQVTSINKNEPELPKNSSTTKKTEKTEIQANNISNVNENQAPVTPKKYAYEDYPVTVGEASSKGNFSYAQFMRSIENYLSISQIGLERSRDIATYLNNHFINDPSLSGFENRYTLSAICHVGAILQSIENRKTPPYEYTIGNSFPIHSKNMGVGIAFNQIHGGTYNSILLNLSIAYHAVISRNSSILFGGGINVKSIDRAEIPLIDYPWGSSSPQLLQAENQSTSLNLGVRFLHKSLYASVSASNVYNLAFTGDYHKSLSPFSLRLTSGGKLRLNQTWSFNPSFNYQFVPYSSNSYFVPYLSLSKMNKLYFGIHSENFKSIGAHIGYRAGNSFNLFFRTGLSLNKTLTDAYGRIHYGEVGIRVELGEYRK